MAHSDTESLSAMARGIFSEAWAQVMQAAAAGPLEDALEDTLLRHAVRVAMTSATKTYRYVLPTQLCAKLADDALDCRSIQKNSGYPGSFDARSLCDAVIVPFDRNNNGVLGGSPEPYVNNPLRVPAIAAQHTPAMKDKQTWDALIVVLGAVEGRQDPVFTAEVFRQTLIEIHRRLADVAVLYPAPPRVSLERCIQVTRTFLDESSGGARPQAVVC
ncbi:MAG: restriction endonuclease, SacI family, partial [Ktedonobacterales bacterium]